MKKLVFKKVYKQMDEALKQEFDRFLSYKSKSDEKVILKTPLYIFENEEEYKEIIKTKGNIITFYQPSFGCFSPYVFINEGEKSVLMVQQDYYSKFQQLEVPFVIFNFAYCFEFILNAQQQYDINTDIQTNSVITNFLAYYNAYSFFISSMKSHKLEISIKNIINSFEKIDINPINAEVLLATERALKEKFVISDFKEFQKTEERFKLLYEENWKDLKEELLNKDILKIFHEGIVNINPQKKKDNLDKAYDILNAMSATAQRFAFSELNIYDNLIQVMDLVDSLPAEKKEVEKQNFDQIFDAIKHFMIIYTNKNDNKNKQNKFTKRFSKWIVDNKQYFSTSTEEKIKNTCLVHSDSVEFTSFDEHNNFTNTIGDTYVGKRQLNLSEDELEQMSVTDGAEMIRLQQWALNKLIKSTSETVEIIHKRMDKIFDNISEKILKLDEIYVPFSTITGCPHLFTSPYRSEEGIITPPPSVRIYTKALNSIVIKKLPKDSDLEIHTIKNNDEKKAISDFLGECFYLNGACGIEVNSEMCVIPSSKLVPPPDFTNIPEVSRPVMNPDVMRWSLLTAQLGEPKTEDQKTLFLCFHNFLMKELSTAKFLIPMKAGKGFPKGITPSESIKLKKETEFGIVTMPGKKDKDAVQLYTDWKRLYEHLGKDEEWSGMIQKIEGIISVFDCAINVNPKYPTLGFYIDQATFDRHIKKIK